MANIQRGEVEFEHGGEQYILRFSTNALCELEELTGEGALEVFARLDAESVRIGDIRALLWAGLQDNHSITIPQAGELIDAVGISVLGELLGKAAVAAFPTSEDQGGDAGNG